MPPKRWRPTTLSVNGRLGPPWVRTGWFNAERLLADDIERSRRKAARRDRPCGASQTGDFNGLAERINLERDLVTLLTGGCRSIVVGYTVKREYVNVEFSAGIENIGYDAIAGLASPMFIRTVKLKDFPWNGWLTLGIGDRARRRLESDRRHDRSVWTADGLCRHRPRVAPVTLRGRLDAQSDRRSSLRSEAMKQRARMRLSHQRYAACAVLASSLATDASAAEVTFVLAHRERPCAAEHAADPRQAERRGQARSGAPIEP